MPLCPVCGQKSQQLGMLCQCSKAYTIHEDQPKDPLNLLGKQILNKLVPVGIYSIGKSTVSYEAWQTSLERMITLIVMKPEVAAIELQKKRFFTSANKFSAIHQQNLPMLFEELEITDLKTYALLCDVCRGEKLADYLTTTKPDDVILIHIIHQLIQGMSAYHRYNVCVPNMGYDQVLICRSGGDSSFVKLTGVIEAILNTPEEEVSTADDVWCLGQLSLSILTGQTIPITNVELTEERAYLMSIVQLFMRATAPIEERYQTAGELLIDFETLLDVHPKAPSKSVASLSLADTSHKEKPIKNSVEMKQILWMHRPPFVEE